MAGTYKGRPTGADAIAKKFQDLQRQIDGLRSNTNLKSVNVEDGAVTVSNTKDKRRTTVAPGSISIWDNYAVNPKGAGNLGVYYDGNGLETYNTLVMKPPYTAGNGNQNTLSLVGQDPVNPGSFNVYSDGLISLWTQNIDGDPQGKIQLVSPVIGLFNIPSTGSAANLRLDTIGGEYTIGISSSSLRYKQDVEDLEVDPDAFLQIRPRKWRDKFEVENDPETTKTNIGFIAEEIEALGLPFVDYNKEGQPEALQYERMMTGAVAVLKRQQQEINDLKAAVAALQAANK